MKIIISPAKKLNKNAKPRNVPMSFQFLTQAQDLINQLKKLSVLQIKELMNTSDNLSQLNYTRIQNWCVKSNSTFKAIELFDGAVYEAMNISKFNQDDHVFAQNHLRILSGLYGILKPQDCILPYRLEMGTKFKNRAGDNLYSYWGDLLYNHICQELQDDFMINLASDEYSKSLKINNLKSKIITPVFKDFKNGKLKVISFFAKKARGLMCNFIIKNRIINIDDLKLFSAADYKFHMQDNDQLIFTR